MTHKRWQNLLPLYAAGTLARPDMIALERHLAGCRACRTMLEEWRSVAGIVRVEADAWAQAAPPLSPEVRAQLQAGVTTSSNGYHKDLPAWSLEQTLYRQKPVGSRSGARRFHLPVTLGAAAAVILAFGFLLLTIISRDKPVSPLSQPGLSPTVSPTGTPAPSGTRSTGPTVIPLSAMPVSIEPQDLGILPVVTATPAPSGPGPSLMPPTAATLGAPLNAYQCTAGSATGAPVTLYYRPDRASGTISMLDPGTVFQVIARSDSGWYQVVAPILMILNSDGSYRTVTPNGFMTGWVPGNLVKLYGPCSALPMATPQSPTPTPVPTLIYGESIGMGYMMITTESIGDLPVGTRVRISHAQFDGSQWQYYVVAEDEQRTAWAYASQLTYAPNVTPGPTPTAVFDGSIGSGYLFITTEPVGLIPAGARVRISYGRFDGTDWIYGIVAQDGQTAEARQSQLTFAPDVTPGPTPTAQFGSGIGMGYMFITTEPVGPIQAGARVGIGSAWFDGTDWVYSILTADGQTTAEARGSQLAYAPNVTPGPTPTAQFGGSIGMGYMFITIEPVGPIPAGARVRIGSAWFDGITWVYSIVAEDERTTAEARGSQLTYALPATATPTPSFTLTGRSSPRTGDSSLSGGFYAATGRDA
jgi:hypothetical protein